VAAGAWAAAGRPDSELYRGARLEAGVELLDTRPDQLTERERDYIEASRAAASAEAERDRPARRRLRRGIVATSIALVLAVVAGAVALQQRQEADEQAAKADVARLVSLSESLVGTKRDVAALLALEASRRAPGQETTGALQSVFFTDTAFLGYAS